MGEHEGAALRAARAGRHPPRGGPWDLTLAALGAAGFGVACVRVVALVGNTYHARVHLRRTPGGGPESARARLPPGVAPDARDADIDARPSDAINLALRCGAPVYVLKELAAAMAAPGAPGAPGGARERGGGGAPGGAAGAALAAAAPEGSDARAIAASCIEEIAAFDDPRVLVDLAMRVRSSFLLLIAYYIILYDTLVQQVVHSLVADSVPPSAGRCGGGALRGRGRAARRRGADADGRPRLRARRRDRDGAARRAVGGGCAAARRAARGARAEARGGGRAGGAGAAAAGGGAVTAPGRPCTRA